MIAVKGPFPPVIAVRKGRNAVHLSQQSGTTVDGGVMAVVPLFTDTLCGRRIVASEGWAEITEAATCERCERRNAEIEAQRAQTVDQAHSEALAEDAARDSAALAARLDADPGEQRARRERAEWIEDRRRADRDAALALNPAYRRTRVAWSGVSSVTVRTEWGTEASESLPDASAVTAERQGRTMRLRADEIRPGDVVPVGGVVGTVTGGRADCAPDCAERTDCEDAGKPGHSQCGRREDGTAVHHAPTGGWVTDGPAGVCRHCEQSVWQDSHGSWIDATDGDGCDSPSGVHEVTSGHAPVGGPVPIAVTVTSAMLGSDAGPHLWELYRNTVVDASAQDEIAAAYDALPLRSTERIVALAWQAFEEETLSQARVLRAHKVHYNVVTTDPYANAGELFADLRRTGTIRVLSTRVTGGHPILPNHVNDAFRAVHDILGHAATGRGFDRHGEEAAFQAHSVLYSPLARLALATETRGQNASMLRAGGVFPPERIAVLPEWARALDALQWRDAWNRAPYADAARDHATQGLGRWGS